MNEPDDDKYEDFVPRVRPDRRGSRPRTKERPAHDDAEPGFVIGVDRGRYRVVLDDGGPINAQSLAQGPESFVAKRL